MDEQISKIALGTVQFGLDYGISNQNGRTPESEISEILTYAKRHNIDTLDTAAAYGESESALGRTGVDGFKVISKFSARKGYSLHHALEHSLQKLKIEKLYGFLSHRPTELLENPKLWTELSKLKEEGKIKKAGFSLYSPHELKLLLEAEMIPDLVQVPYNILDDRFEPYFQKLKDQGTEIHTRSAFLQGLFFMNLTDLPEFFLPLMPYLEKIRSVLPDPSMRAGALLNYCIANPLIDKVVVGINNKAQLASNLKALEQSHHLPKPDIPLTNKNLINPSKWPQIQ